MNAVELLSWNWNDNIVWFTWAHGSKLGYYSPDTWVELDTGGRPSKSFRYAIIDAMRRFLTNHPEIRDA